MSSRARAAGWARPPGCSPHSAQALRRVALERLKIDDWNRTIDVNIKGVLYGIAAALPYMKQQKAGHIINVPTAISLSAKSGLRVLGYHRGKDPDLRTGCTQLSKPRREAVRIVGVIRRL